VGGKGEKSTMLREARRVIRGKKGEKGDRPARLFQNVGKAEKTAQVETDTWDKQRG